MKPKILYLSYDGMTDPLGQSQVLPYLSGLASEYEIHLLSCEKENAYKQSKDTIQHICDQSKIQWHPIKYHKSPPVISSVYDYYQLKRKAFKLHKKLQFQLTHCRSYLPAMVGLSLKKSKGVKFLFDMRGFWADERKDAGIWNVNNSLFKIIYSFFKIKEKQYVTQADYTISLTNAGKVEMESWGLEKLSPIQVIPCCADFDLFDYKKIDSVQSFNKRKQLEIPQQTFVLTYLGSIGTWYMLDEMLDFFRVLKGSIPSAKFHFITKEPKELIIHKVVKRGISVDDLIIAPANRSEVPSRLAISDLTIFFIKTYYSKKGSSPTKQAEIMGMGIPLICNSGIGDVDEIVKESNSGFLINNFTDDEYKYAVDQIQKLLSLEKEKIREEGILRFSLKKGVAKYQEVYRKILNR